MTWRFIHRMLLKPRFSRVIAISYLKACVLAAYLGISTPAAQGDCPKPLAAQDIINRLKANTPHGMIIHEINDCKVDPLLAENDVNAIRGYPRNGDIMEALKPFINTGERPQPAAPPPEANVAPPKENVVPKRTTASSAKAKPNAAGTGTSPTPKPAGEVAANGTGATPTQGASSPDVYWIGGWKAHRFRVFDISKLTEDWRITIGKPDGAAALSGRLSYSYTDDLGYKGGAAFSHNPQKDIRECGLLYRVVFSYDMTHSDRLGYKGDLESSSGDCSMRAIQNSIDGTISKVSASELDASGLGVNSPPTFSKDNF